MEVTKELFYIRLPSNVSSDDHFENLIGNYKTKLCKRIELEGEWEVALSEISYTKSWYNVDEEGLKTLIFPYTPHRVHSNDTVEKGFYDTVDKLIMQARKEGIYSVPDHNVGSKSSITFNYLSRKITLHPAIYNRKNTGEPIYGYPTFGNHIDQILGTHDFISKIDELKSRFDEDYLSTLNGKEYEANQSVDLTAGFHSLYVYCDIIEPSIVRDTLTKLLRVVEIPLKSEFGDQVTKIYPNPHFIPLLKRSFDEVEIDIKDDANQTVPFRFGRSIVTLVFRRVNGPSN